MVNIEHIPTLQLDHFCYLCFVFDMLSCLFIAAKWSPAGKGLTSWLSYLWCFLEFLSLSHVVFRVRCGTWLYWFLIFAFLLSLNSRSLHKREQFNCKSDKHWCRPIYRSYNFFSYCMLWVLKRTVSTRQFFWTLIETVIWAPKTYFNWLTRK